MKRAVWILVAAGLMVSSMAWAGEDAPPPVDWRNDSPGWGVGLRFGPEGPGAGLRGWASPVLSVDVGGGVEHEAFSGDQVAEGRRTGAWLDVAPRVRVVGTDKVDVMVVPSVLVSSTVQTDELFESRNAYLRGSFGFAVDRWFGPGVSVTGRLDIAQVGIWSDTVDGSVVRGRTAAVSLSPTVAIHVFPAGLGRRGRP